MSDVAVRSPIVLDVWVDVVCPWCYIAKHRLHKAVVAWERPHEVRIRYRAFELDPGLAPGQRVPVVEYLGRKYRGGASGGQLMADRVTALAQEVELELDLASAVKANTFDAHRLIALAREMGGPQLEQAALERMFFAHFVEGLAIDDHGALQRISAEAGLDERRVSSVLASEEYAAPVRSDEAEAQRLGITAVPFLLAKGEPVHGEVAVAGAQSIDTYLELFRRVTEQPA